MTSQKDKIVQIDVPLVKQLIASQFPQWQSLSIRPVSYSGWDNRTFHLGDEMIVRMPSNYAYASQVTKEQKWLPILAPNLPLKIPQPLAMGNPDENYPWHWSVYHYLPGESAATAIITDLCSVAKNLAQFLNVLESIDATKGPVAGEHSFYRGGLLSVYDNETRTALSKLKGKIDVGLALSLWEQALITNWQNNPAWVHGDISPGNLLIYKKQLIAVIDFGQLAIGDPACDLSITWTFFKDKSRDVFRNSLNFDSGTWARARAWTLWKALIIAADLTESNASDTSRSWNIIETVLNDYCKYGE